MTETETILITGGTGSFGSAFAEFLLTQTTAHVRIFSRDEMKHEALARRFPPSDRLSYLLGDVRDRDRLRIAMDGCAAVVHAAAYKVVGQGERHASEFVKTNVGGTENVRDAAIAAGVSRSLFISSDKSVAALNHYGKTKAAAEGLFIQGNALGVSRGCRFAVVRGGNVWGSRGSVVEVWRDKASRKETLEMNNGDVTRFHLLMPDWVRFCHFALCAMHGGEIFLPKCPAWRLGDLAEAFGGYAVNMGARGGDKPHEYLAAPEETASGRVVDLDWGYCVEPPADLRKVWDYQPWPEPKHYEDYTSRTAARLTVAELRAIL